MSTISNEQLMQIVDSLSANAQKMFKRGPNYFNKNIHYMWVKQAANKMFNVVLTPIDTRELIERYFRENPDSYQEPTEPDPEPAEVPHDSNSESDSEDKEDEKEEKEEKSKAKAKTAKKTTPKRAAKATNAKTPRVPKTTSSPRALKSKSSSSSSKTSDKSEFMFNEDGFMENYSVELSEEDAEKEPTLVQTTLTAEDLIKLINPETVNVSEYLKKYKDFVKALNNFKEEHTVYPKNGKLLTKKAASSKLELRYYDKENLKKSAIVDDEGMVKAYVDWKEYNKTIELTSVKRTVLPEVAYKILTSKIMHTPFILSCDSAVKIGMTNEDYCYDKLDIPSTELDNSAEVLDLIKEFAEDLKSDALDKIKAKQTAKITAITTFQSKTKDIWKYRSGIVNDNELTDELKLKCWNQAKANIENKEDIRSNILNAWKNILSSPFCFYIFMYGIEENDFITSALHTLFLESVKLFTEELYPICFVATPFMLGSEDSGEPTNIRPYFTDLITSEKSSMIYYLLNHEGEQYNKTISVVDGKKDKLNKIIV